MEPHKFIRGHLALSEQDAAKDSALNTYHINGMEVSEDPAEAVHIQTLNPVLIARTLKARTGQKMIRTLTLQTSLQSAPYLVKAIHKMNQLVMWKTPLLNSRIITFDTIVRRFCHFSRKVTNMDIRQKSRRPFQSRTGKGKSKSKDGHAKGKGKGRRGVKRSYCQDKHKSEASSSGGNPFGRDGKPLRCSICESTDQFRADCLKNTNKGKGKTKAHLAQAQCEYLRIGGMQISGEHHQNSLRVVPRNQHLCTPVMTMPES